MMERAVTVFSPRAAAATDDRWYESVTAAGFPTAAGVRVSEDAAYTLSALWRGVQVVSGSIGMMPLQMFERIGDRRRELASAHPLYDLLHNGPNPRQTSIEWRLQMQASLMLRGNAYSLIVPGPRGPIDQLWPLHPDRVRVQELPNRRLVYQIRTVGTSPTWEAFPEEWVFHIRGLSSNGVTGMSLLQYARESFGEGISAQQWGARFFGQSLQPSGVLEHPGELSDTARERVEESFQGTYGGPDNAWKFMVLEEGMKWHQMSLTAQDAQFILTRKFNIEEASRWTGVPPHLLGHTERQTSWGTGLEQQNLGLLLFTILPWTTIWEQAIAKDLIVHSDRYYAEFNLDSYLRGDARSRAEANRIAVTSGWRSPNEVRRQDNDEPVAGLDYYLRPLNMVAIEPGKSQPQQLVPLAPPDQSPPPLPPPGNGSSVAALRPGDRFGGTRAAEHQAGRLALLAKRAAERVVRKEVVALRKALGRAGADRALFTAEAGRFYAGHVAYVALELQVPNDVAQDYCACQLAQLDEFVAVGEWDSGVIVDLAHLAATAALARSAGPDQ